MVRGDHDEAAMPDFLLAALLIGGGLVRYYYADVNSYWYDEVLSVYYYGISNQSISGVFDRVTSSIQMPLYQSILYGWMDMFGDSEVSTRTLSNIYIVGATLCLYLSVRHVYGSWIGFIAALVFSLMFIPTYYGLETRAYAQSIFLTSLSTLLLIYVVPSIADQTKISLLRNLWLYALLTTNSLVLMTHYYNVLFLGAQGLFILIYLLHHNNTFINSIIKSFAIAVAPIALLLVTWLPFMISAYERASGGNKYLVDALPIFPWETLYEFVLWPNFNNPLLLPAAVMIVAWVAVSACFKLFRRPSEKTYFTIWFLFATILPTFFAFFLFLIAGHERYHSRYFSFSAGPLAVVLTLGVFQIICTGTRVMPALKRLCIPITALATALLVVPGGVKAIGKSKEDWRGIAAAVVERINSEPSKRFAVFATNFKPIPMFDYYLSRFSDRIRVDEMLMRYKERSDRPIDFTPPDADFVVVIFPHQRVPHFPRTLEVFNSKMNLLEEHLDKRGRGYLVYSVLD